MKLAQHWKKVQRFVFQVLLLLVSSASAFAAVFYISPIQSSANDLKAGDVATQDILAPYALRYNSAVLTEQERQAASINIAPMYTSADTNIARQQLEQLRTTLAFITSARSDPYASKEQKLADLAALKNAQFNQEISTQILGLNETRWQAIQQESISVLEQVMRNTIREDQMENYRRTVPNLVSLAFPEEQAKIVAEIVSAFITPNSFYSEALTEEARAQAIGSVPPIEIEFISGETILERGDVVSALDVEALQAFGLAEPEIRWQDIVSTAVLVFMMVSLVLIYLIRKPEISQNLGGLFLISLLLLIFLASARLVFPIHPFTAYLFPISAFALITAGLFGAQPALVLVIPLILLVTYGYTNSLELILYFGVSSLFGVLIPRQEQRITGFIWVGLNIAAVGATVLLVFRLPESNITAATLVTYSILAFLNGIIAAGFTVLTQSMLAPLLGQTTPLQLLELSRPDHPLLEYLLRNAPGTYQHSLQVANLSEQAAERIDADSLLTRVGALYHDIGKAENAQFFIENQAPGNINTHEDLPPIKSAAYIRNHVIQGLELAKKHKLPRRIQDFIVEHHGTFKTRYQWAQAVNAANGDLSQIDERDFQYIGPRPQSRETALVMLADGTEARVRAKRPETEEALRAIVKDSVETCMDAGQLDDTPLTLKELTQIVDSFTATLRGIYHPRVEYPKMQTKPTPPEHEQVAPAETPENAAPVDQETAPENQPTP